jgi:hypothetical protein
MICGQPDRLVTFEEKIMSVRHIVTALALGLAATGAQATEMTAAQHAAAAAKHSTAAVTAAKSATAAKHRGPTAATHHRKAAEHHRKAAEHHEAAAAAAVK